MRYQPNVLNTRRSTTGIIGANAGLLQNAQVRVTRTNVEVWTDSPLAYRPPSSIFTVLLGSTTSPISATLNGLAAQTATIKGAGALAATPHGVANTALTIKGAGALVAAPHGVGHTAPTISGAGALAATPHGVAQTTSTIRGAGALSVTIHGVAAGIDTLVGKGALSGSSNGVAHVTATFGGSTSPIVAALHAGATVTSHISAALFTAIHAAAHVTGTLKGAGALANATHARASVKAWMYVAYTVVDLSATPRTTVIRRFVNRLPRR